MDYLHTWAGLLFSVLLLVVFFMGTLSVFDREIDRWMMPDTRISNFSEPSFDRHALRTNSVLLTHVSSAWQIGRGELQLGIRNLFDRKYFSLTSQADNDSFSWILDEGRRVSVNYSVKW